MSDWLSVDDRHDLPRRVALLRYGLAAVFIGLAISFWYLQVVQHATFQQLAELNYQRRLALRAPRGVLLDRDGRVLVENRYSFNISIVREQVKDLDRTVHLLASTVRVDAQAVRDELGRQRRQPAHRPVVVVAGASLAQVAAVTARKIELPGVVVEQMPARRYPGEELAAHLFGYVGEVSGAQLTRTEFQGVASGAIVGQSGLELIYNRQLMGADGERRVVVNSMGREIQMLEEIEPVEGQPVQLTLDSALQRAAEEAFAGSGFWGAAVVLAPRTGEVLALVSLPSFDPNAFAVGIDRTTWSLLNSDRLRPLQNRAIQGRYSPGSIFKIVVAVAALEEGVVAEDRKVHCSGAAVFYGRAFRCNRAQGHGWVDLRQAIEQSCNVYFYTVGNLVGIDRLHTWATALGLGELSGIDLPSEAEGVVPSTAWKWARTGEKWYAGETISVAIGQGQVWVTPISLAVMVATIANGGTRVTPYLRKAVGTPGGWTAIAPPAPRSTLRLKPETVRAVHDGLWLAVNGAGTGARGRVAGRDVAGKTGTAQVISAEGKQAARRSSQDLRDHGWFVFFAPRDNPEIAGVVLAEHAEHGYLAAPIARHVIETYFAKKERQPLPTWPAQQPAIAGSLAGAEPATRIGRAALATQAQY